MRRPFSKPIVFGGPSLRGLSPEMLARVELRPPARRGDFDELRRRNQAGTAVLTDGVFGSSMSVTPLECRQLIDAGWCLIGSSSMGALRAAELWSVGMIGVGNVYCLYRSGVLRSDADVAVLYALPNYDELTIPTVHVRRVLQSLEDGGTITGARSRRLLRKAERVFWTDRNVAALRDAWADELEESTWMEARAMLSDAAASPKRDDASQAVRLSVARRWTASDQVRAHA